MATRAQIEANRLNARKSTGPSTLAGKAVSSRNARTHGMTTAPSDELVRAYFDAICASRDGSCLSTEGETRALALALRLARAEAALSQVRKGASNILTNGDDQLRLRPEADMIIDLFHEDGLIWEPLTPRERDQFLRLLIRLSKVGAKSAKQTYARQLRYLRAAEARHEEALSAWLEGVEGGHKPEGGVTPR